MKRFKFFTFLLCLFSQLHFVIAQSAGEWVELEQNMNGRSSKSFYKKDQNVRLIVPSGTKGKILEVAKLKPTGNHALKVQVPHPKTGEPETVWIYYRNENPGMSLYKSEEDLNKKVQASLEEIKNAKEAVVKTEREIASITAKDEKAEKQKDKEMFDQDYVKNTIDSIAKGNDKLKDAGKPPCDHCELYLAPVGNKKVPPAPKPKPAPAEKPKVEKPKPSPSSPEPSTDEDDGRQLLPKRSHLRESMGPLDNHGLRAHGSTNDRKSCKGYAPGMIPSYVICTGLQSKRPITYSLESYRKLLSDGTWAIRDWELWIPDEATQNFRLRVNDVPSSTTAHEQFTDLVFLPRTTLPKMETQGRKTIMTLPTGEKVEFDAKTNRITGGALSEGELGRATRSLNPPPVQYNGRGVLIRVNSTASDPRQNNTATITKPGEKPCQVPTKYLWSNNSARTNLDFKFATDKEADQFLRSQCGFGIN